MSEAADDQSLSPSWKLIGSSKILFFFFASCRELTPLHIVVLRGSRGEVEEHFEAFLKYIGDLCVKVFEENSSFTSCPTFMRRQNSQNFLALLKRNPAFLSPLQLLVFSTLCPRAAALTRLSFFRVK